MGLGPIGPIDSMAFLGPKALNGSRSWSFMDVLGLKALNRFRSGFSLVEIQPWSPWYFSQAILHVAHAIFLRISIRNCK
jgi:hypothetical protein